MSANEAQRKLLQQGFGNCDVAVDGLPSDVYRKGRINYREGLCKLRRPAMIVDIKNGAILEGRINGFQKR